jgi:hypothetical protein
LGTKLEKTVLSNGVVAWGTSQSKYVYSDVKNVQEYLAALPGDKKLLNKCPAPFSGGYNPELDEKPELVPVMVNFVQSQIGILRWYVELGRISIIAEVSMLFTYLCLSREGHFYAVFHVCAYLSLHINGGVIVDPTYPTVNMGALIKTDWKSMYAVAMKNGIETYRGFHYRLRMMGVTLGGPTFVFGYNMYVVHNTQRPEYVLKKKSNSICYHVVRKSSDTGESIIGHVPSVVNPADICTKIVPGGQKRNHLIHLLLHDLCD